jgi:hypothetical protein
VTCHNGVDNQTEDYLGARERVKKESGKTKDSCESRLRVEREGGDSEKKQWQIFFLTCQPYGRS